MIQKAHLSEKPLETSTFGRPRKGFALILVITICFSLLIFASLFINQTRQTTPLNYKFLANIQANFLGQGVAQIIALKVKKLPGPLYYAAIAKNKGIDSTPYDSYTLDPILNPSMATPTNAVCNSSISLLPSTVYERMNFRIKVDITIRNERGEEFQRSVEHSLYGKIEGNP